jgi:nitrite reductase/ring-hydroxylating ferredoxin subunit
MERIFQGRWICALRESEIAAPGAYKRVDIGAESVIVLRDTRGAVRAFHNVCRHRGARICEAAQGRLSKSIQCPYHAWTYGLDGELIGAPMMQGVEDFDRADYPLHPVATGLWEGFVFIHLGDDPEPLIVGWDGAGVVAAVGAEVRCFSEGDAVYFAGDITRPGSYAEYVVVDERVAGRKPVALSFEDAAAVPPHRAHRMGGPDRGHGRRCCARGVGAEPPHRRGAGGVGESVDYVFSTAPLGNFGQLVACLKPLGKICVILAGKEADTLDVSGLFQIRGSLFFEYMFTRSKHRVAPERQGQILNRVSDLLDQGVLVTTRTAVHSWTEMAQAHRALEIMEELAPCRFVD